MWQSGLPVVLTTAARPSSSMPKKTCGWEEACTPSIATCTSPSVAFLNPTGIDRPEVSCRCTWLSGVRAPIAPQVTASAMYCGLVGSRNSQPTGRPRLSTSSSTVRAVRRPRRTSWPPSMSGSLMSPFQPIVVRGFSK